MQNFANLQKIDMEPQISNEAMQVFVEKRRRNQLYLTLNYLLNLGTFFDFCSYDAFNLLKSSKDIAKKCNSKIITLEHFFLAFFEKESALISFLKGYGITKESLFVTTSPEKQKSLPFIQSFLNLNRKKIKKQKSFLFSHDLSTLFKKAIKNAHTRFKTPIITPEIFFITLIEQKFAILESWGINFPLTKNEGYLLRYDLLKQIHNAEIFFRSKTTKNNRIFSYLLKTQLSNLQFKRLIEDKSFPLGLLFFRNQLLLKSGRFSLNLGIENEIYRSIKVINTRKYSCNEEEKK